MNVDEVKARARRAAQDLLPPPGPDEELVRSALMRFLSRVPEPPVYRRREDPAQKAAAALRAEGEALLAQVYRTEGHPTMAAWSLALEAHLEGLCLLEAGRVEAADAAWQRAVELERRAASSRRLWARTDEVRPPVYSRASGTSRYDPRPEAAVRAKLPCPRCRKVGDFAFFPRVARNELSCHYCASPFTAYVAELRQLEVQRFGSNRRYLFRVEELAGGNSKVLVDDVGKEEFQASRRDLLAFLYAPEEALRGVLNLTTSRVLWLAVPSKCFVATAVFGEGAPELEVLRTFRDRVLLRRALGRAFVGWYYRAGPGLARSLAAHPRLGRATRLALLGLVAFLRLAFPSRRSVGP